MDFTILNIFEKSSLSSGEQNFWVLGSFYRRRTGMKWNDAQWRHQQRRVDWIHGTAMALL